MQKVTLKLNPDYVARPAKVGLGTKIKRAIHAVLDAVPLPVKARRALKGCPGCTQREQDINDRAQRFKDRRDALRRRLAGLGAKTRRKS